jgi:hypothetical protein
MTARWDPVNGWAWLPIIDGAFAPPSADDYERELRRIYEEGLREPAPIPMLLWCPACGTRHIDKGDFATKPHHTHACQNDHCGLVWRPAVVHTVGVQHLPGFKDPPPRGVTGPSPERMAEILRDEPTTVDADGSRLCFLDRVESTERPGHRATVGPIDADGTFGVCDIDLGQFSRQQPSQWRKVTGLKTNEGDPSG